MSGVVDEWNEGLSTRALQKIPELESQLDKLKKERQQRQFQLESLEAALQKQKQKVENEKNDGATLKRDNQSLMELCDNLEKMKQKILHDLQVKESQVNYQAGQLTSSKKQIERVEQELKRYKSELERSQQTLITGDLSFRSIPQKNFSVPLTPNKNHSGKDDYETWRDFTVPLVQEWECSDVEKWKRVLESLKGPAMRLIRALKDSQPAATVQDYLTALESVYGATDSSEDLYYRFRQTYQEPHERLSDFIRRLEDLLQQVRQKEDISIKRIDSARLDQSFGAPDKMG
ncbi:centromere protein F-like [Gopherus flavomarginatus]|uniref:centromere protein F-like n=1 Tax=Gopherus flavomarginatus TaxID=286002 RepID=UPI0021CC4472|nr:centromere protein F-like [Gopherus flavomarginatus]